LLLRAQPLQHGEVFERGRVAADSAARRDFTKQAAHDFTGARLWERVRKPYLVGARERADLACDVAAQLLLQIVRGPARAFERDEGDHDLSLQLVGATGDRGLRARL